MKLNDVTQRQLDIPNPSNLSFAYLGVFMDFLHVLLELQ